MNRDTGTSEVVLCPFEVVRAIDHETEAVVECWQRRKDRCSQRKASEDLHIDKGNFTRLLDEQITIPKNKRVDFMVLTGNMLPLQFEALQLGCAVVPIDELERLKKQERRPLLRIG